MHALCLCTSPINCTPLTLGWLASWFWVRFHILVMMFGSSNWSSNLPFNYCGTEKEGATSRNLHACLLGSFVDFHVVRVWESRLFGLWLQRKEIGSAGFFSSRDTFPTFAPPIGVRRSLQPIRCSFSFVRPRNVLLFTTHRTFFPVFPLFFRVSSECETIDQRGYIHANHKRLCKQIHPNPLNLFLLFCRLPASSTMRSACLSLLLVTACWALPFHQSGFLDFMMDEPGSGVPDATLEPLIPTVPLMPKCPFRCQCHLRVVQCSDLGKPTHGFYSGLLHLISCYSTLWKSGAWTNRC